LVGRKIKHTVEANGHKIDAAAYRKSLVMWGGKHFRSFPWRLTEDPYHILIAEVMLHRTQAIQVVPVYERFMARYPDIPTLARATKKELHKALYSLGLRWRTDLIYQMTKELMTRFNGQIPTEEADLTSLPGVSQYIASAVRCFAWNLPEPLIDTNTVRVIGRMFGLRIKDSSRRNNQFQNLIIGLVDKNKARAYNYAILDLADQVCMKKRPPDCRHCPLRKQCSYATRANLSS